MAQQPQLPQHQSECNSSNQHLVKISSREADGIGKYGTGSSKDTCHPEGGCNRNVQLARA